MRRIKVLLLTTKQIFDSYVQASNNRSTFPLFSSELKNYIQLISVSNISFDIKFVDDLSFDDLIKDSMVKYTTIILIAPEKELSKENINAIRSASHDYGISIIASYDRINEKTKHFFGINKLKRKGPCFHCSILPDKKKFIDIGIEGGIEISPGWNIGIQRWGFRRDPAAYIKKHLKKFGNQVFRFRKVIAGDGTKVLATIGRTSESAIICYRFGKAMNYYIALQSDFYLMHFNPFHKIVKHLITENSGYGMVCIDSENTMILRMDDPGTCERVYLKGFDTRILGGEDWKAIFKLLEKYDAKLSVMYVPVWIDDGNLENGRLYIDDEEIKKRKSGAAYLSKNVKFLKKIDNKLVTYDYENEYSALKEGLRKDLLDIESHGLTHVDTDIDQWLGAEDRYLNMNWYHEFRHVVSDKEVLRGEQVKVLKESADKIEEIFGVSPAAVTPSGHMQSKNTISLAEECGYRIFSSEYNTIYKNGISITNDKFKSVFFEFTEPEPASVSAGYPIVGVFHDYDIAKKGINWLEGVIKAYRRIGIEKFMSLREFADYLSASIEAYWQEDKLKLEVDIANTGGVSNHPSSRYFFDHNMLIDIHLPKEKRIESVTVKEDPRFRVEHESSRGHVKLNLPPFKHRDKMRVIISFLRDTL